MGFIVATLGKSDNKTNFISNQKTNYPDFTSWKSDDIQDDFMQQVQEKSKKLFNCANLSCLSNTVFNFFDFS